MTFFQFKSFTQSKSDESNDFVTYTTIADVHLTNGLTKFTADDKKKLVEGFKGILSDFVRIYQTM